MNTTSVPLNLPILHHLQDAERVLILGAGGGFDIYAGLPLYFTLKDHGKTVHLANYSFSEVAMTWKLSDDAITLIEETLVGARGPVSRRFPYYPEGFLAEWFDKVRGEREVIWMMERSGVKTMATAYTTLLRHLGGVDALILVDGGVDSLMRGNEAGAGSIVGDTATLAAVENLDIPIKILASVGFGTETEENVCHYNALENMAGLAAEGAFYGVAALTAQMEAFQLYEQACKYTWEQPQHAHSHISTRIIPAVRGQFGNFHMYPKDRGVPLMISPLMSLYWFYDAHAVIERNMLIPFIRETLTHQDLTRLIYRQMREGITRPWRKIPY